MLMHRSVSQFWLAELVCPLLLQAAVLDTYDKLQEWSYVSENLTLGNTTGVNAAMLLLAAKAHQVVPCSTS